MNSQDNEKARQAIAKEIIAAKSAPAAQLVSRQELKVQQQFHRGPLPPPEVLKRYNDALPNGAERIMVMAEREQSHTHDVERKIVWLTAIGQLGGFIIIAGAITIGFYLVLHDKPIQGFSSFFGGLGVLLGGGYLSRKRSEKPPVKKVD